MFLDTEEPETRKQVFDQKIEKDVERMKIAQPKPESLHARGIIQKSDTFFMSLYFTVTLVI